MPKNQTAAPSETTAESAAAPRGKTGAAARKTRSTAGAGKPARKAANAAKPAKSATPVKAAKAGNGGPTRTAARTRRSPEEVQARILEAAMHEFSEFGFAGARIDRISSRAKTVDRMLYYYFGNKERLYQTTLEAAYAEMIEAEGNFVVPDGDPVQGIRELVGHTWNLYVSRPQIIRIIMNENLLRGRFIKKSRAIRQKSLPLIALLENILKQGQAQGLFRLDVDASLTLMTMMSLGFFYVANSYTISHWLRADMMEPERCRAWEAHISQTLLASLRA
ncbi:TetR family transcriptional regulator [Ramlibacter sp. AW1]|uniref:TetR family transcriptional regulator n=1 Tax=Ramlibacter aurantiacus TaxID=2801330 RepID=A0A936ZSA3_9BURK|nr:TetR/AcrR family transcriptional regulator [Ramlibacter aurantiacus]MBL0421631.1 TetR family transcriptional regulator [Ramlibacter aurantiacus]